MAEIMVLTVDPEFRRKRVGTGLLRQAESWAKEQGSKYMFMFFAGCDLLPSDTFSLLLGRASFLRRMCLFP